MIVGDLNIALNKLNNYITKRYLQALDSLGLTVTNNQITRPSSSNILDHVVCSMDKFYSIHNDTIENDISDHCYIMSTIDLKAPAEKIKLKQRILNNSVIKSKFYSFCNTLDTTDTLKALEIIVKYYNDLVKKYSKIVEVDVKLKNKKCLWFNFKIYKLSKIKSKIFKKSRANQTDVHLKELLEHVSKKLKQEQNKAKKSYYETFFDSTNQKLLWSKINTVLGKGKNYSTEKTVLSVDNCILDKPNAICTSFNTFFTEIGDKLASSIKSTENVQKFGTMNRISESFFFHPSSANEVSQIIKKLKSGKSPGPDNIPVDLIKENSIFFSNFLSSVFNFCIENGRFPDILKVAKVNNYRPISTLSIFNKIIESLVFNRLLDFLEKKHFFYSFQYGFRKNCGTLNSVLEITDLLLRELDKSNIAGGTFLDLSKAFDTINHKLLLQKLEMYGIRGPALSFFEDYLTNRRQFVAYGGETSTPLSVKIGVPQGSNLGPLLFLIFINDISKLQTKGSIRLFADDTAIFYSDIDSSHILENMKSDLLMLKEYFDENLLSLNCKKTKFMLFCNKNKEIENIGSITIGNVVIERVRNMKFLGIVIDERLQWDTHIDSLLKSLSPLCGVLWKIRNFVPRNILLKIYFSSIHSRLQYLNVVWATASLSKIKPLQVLQNRCLKAIYRLPILFSTWELYSRAKILPLLGMYGLQLSCHTYKVVRNQTIHSFNFRNNTRVNTRQANCLYVAGVRTEKCKKSFSYAGPYTFNKLLTDIVNAFSIEMFKSKLKKHIFENILHYII